MIETVITSGKIFQFKMFYSTFGKSFRQLIRKLSFLHYFSWWNSDAW